MLNKTFTSLLVAVLLNCLVIVLAYPATSYVVPNVENPLYRTRRFLNEYDPVVKEESGPGWKRRTETRQGPNGWSNRVSWSSNGNNVGSFPTGGFSNPFPGTGQPGFGTFGSIPNGGFGGTFGPGFGNIPDAGFGGSHSPGFGFGGFPNSGNGGFGLSPPFGGGAPDDGFGNGNGDTEPYYPPGNNADGNTGNSNGSGVDDSL